MERRKSAKKTKREAVATTKENQEDFGDRLLAEALASDFDEAVGRLSVSGRKRSLYLPGESNCAEDLEEYDVEEEKEKLRKEEEAKKAKEKKVIQSTVETQFGVLNTLSAEEIENHYSTCIKMCSQNKVNSKNAFKLQLIDYMKMIVSKRSTKTENLSLMSCTLDASAKIYSYRVDKVYNDMMKIVSFKGGKRSNEDEEDDKIDDGENEEDEEEDCELAKKRRSSCDEDEDDNKDDVTKDPKFQQAWTKVLGDPRGFQRHKIEEEVYGETLPKGLDYFLECTMSGADYKLSLEGPLIEKAVPPPTESFISCPKIQTDELEGEDDFATLLPGYNEMRDKFHLVEDDRTISSLVTSQDSLGGAYYPNAELMDVPFEDDQDCLDDDMGPGFDDDDDDGGYGDSAGGMLSEEAERRGLLATVGSMPQRLSNPPSLRASMIVDPTAVPLPVALAVASSSSSSVLRDSGVDQSRPPTTAQLLDASVALDAKVLKNSRFTFWGGPKTWRRKPVPSRWGAGGRATERKTEKKDKSLRFTEQAAMACSKKVINSLLSGDYKLSKKTIVTWSEKTNTYPPEVENLQQKIFSFFNCESISMIRIKMTVSGANESNRTGKEDSNCLFMPNNFDDKGVQRTNESDNGDNAERDYNGDVGGGGDDGGGDGDGDCDGDDYMCDADDRDVSLFDQSGDMFDRSGSNNMSHIDENALVPVPHKVQKVEVKYCKVQKRIDIKLVKKTIWDLISLEEENKENVCSETTEVKLPAKRKCDNQPTSSKPVRFSDVFGTLKQQLPEGTSNELTYPIAFMSLLHLANEKNLKLATSEGLNDVDISVNTV